MAPVSPATAIPPLTARPGRAGAGPIAAPDPALLEPGHGSNDGALPRIGQDGRRPSQVYAAGFTPDPARPNIGLVVAGIGLSAMDTEQVIRLLPAAVTLAVSPYSPNMRPLLTLAREAGHELLLSIPMEPMGFPLNDPGDRALLSSATMAQNQRNLRWALGRFAGYAGTTGALGGLLNGERFPMLDEQMRAMLEGLAARGLFYVDPRPAQKAAPSVWNRGIDLVVDDPGDRGSVEARLAELERVARAKGSALGLVEIPTPMVLERIAAWSHEIAARGFALAPASALMQAPAATPAAVGQPESGK